MANYFFPVDPDCPEVYEYRKKILQDPMTEHVPGDVIGDLFEDFENKHRPTCARCQEYGCAHVDMG